ncbi:tRNA synthetase Pheb [Thermoplasma volcanium GSS1]|uniref:Phenylalanine--tRNA ligase beta subunit n=1 Tax=Thermoplasma volcanium (strain ATCC 51530 / DSM 4299 / JCM 9571 / NBRC 15438 / GSS1) TaxID=273116 RepID=SYFB_THEVO|nr:phenylalanine--tRNA ligase subunit beta [Thermoplasma volcanium]Q97B53.1 RecName: Full=Phenylalanine--tRNA ligase beta subunit; AltName: Full=Phenylalanyl-tRNA synthetase beta subunit; Short=PheRS [Thermoplasma volcanium GSS1]BAB59747.1 tRNA synthetase Pheb [Thermoplasma volcanium GSS1]
MVVVRRLRQSLVDEYGKEIYSLLKSFADVIGYSFEDEEEIKIEFNPDRPDLFSIPTLVGAAKIFYYNEPIVRSLFQASEIEVAISEGVSFIRPYFAGFVAEGPSIGSKLDDLIDYQEIIHQTVGKERKKVSIGIHDLDKTEPPFRYTTISKLERMKTYDSFEGTIEDVLQKHPKGMAYSSLLPDSRRVPAILDKNGGILSVPPIVNGIMTKIEPETRKFFVDITGMDSNSVKYAFYLLANFFQSSKYRISLPKIKGSYGPSKKEILDFNFRPYRLNLKYVSRYLGDKVSEENVILNLRKMGYVAEPGYPEVMVYVPGFRVDVMGLVDIIEDFIKSYGIENVREQYVSPGTIGSPNIFNEIKEKIRDVVVGLGFQEVMTFVLTGKYYQEDFQGEVRIENPKSEDYSVIRDRLYLNLLDLLARNKKHPLPQRIFEIGDVIVHGKQETHLCVMVEDNRSGVSTSKSILTSFLKRFSDHESKISGKKIYGCIEGRSGEIFLSGKSIGVIGEVHPSTLENFGLVNPISFFEINIQELIDQHQ